MSDRSMKILVADDEESMRFVLRELIERLGYQVVEASDGKQALDALNEQTFGLAILDINMPEASGLDVLREARKIDPDMISLVVTAYGTHEMAMDAIRNGAYDYFTKPFEVEELRTTIQRALEKKQLLNQISELEQQVARREAFREIIGSCEAMETVFNMMERVIENDVPVLIMGESGTGKELVADAIHNRGPRKDKPIIKVNCAAIPEQLLESELFGHEKGSFTGATDSRAGRFEQAQGGTLFLDEIGDMPLSLQAKILRALQEGEVQRVGGKAPIPVDVRLLTATNRNLAEEVAAKRFREDLYFRINVIAIVMPPLRNRLTDIPLLVNHFIQIHNAHLSKSVSGVSQEVMDLFLDYAWPGNIREMENVIQRALIMATGPQIQPPDLPPNISPYGHGPRQAPLNNATVDFSLSMPEQVERAVEQTETAMIQRALQKAKSRQETADLLGISRKSLHNKMQKYGIKD